MPTQNCHTCHSPVKEGAKFCSSCGATIPEQPEPQFVETQLPSAARAPRKPMSSNTKRLYGLITFILLAIFGYVFLDHLPGRSHPIIEGQPSIAMATMYAGQTLNQFETTARISNGKIIVPLTLLLEKKIIAFDYKTEATIIPLLAFINSDGKLVTAFRMCEPCNSKTFRIEGTEIGCGNCETQWKSANLEGLQGSCQKYPPDPIPSEIVNGEIRIDESVVRNWKMRI